MSHHQETRGRRFVPHVIKYPLFLLGLVIIIVGGVTGIKLGLGTTDEATIAVVGFVMMILGIIAE